MSGPIGERDPRLDLARSVAAEQQALRALRAQMAAQSQALQSSDPGFQPAEVQEIAREGLISSRRLAQELGGMLQDRPHFNFFQSRATEDAVTADSAAQRSDGESASPEFVAFQPSPQEDLPLFNPRPRARPDRENPGSPDLNLSDENRQRALQQGTPSTASGRAALDLFLQKSTPEATPANASQQPESSDPIASRAQIHFERSHVSTAAATLGEERGVTDSELVLDRSDPSQAQTSIQQELKRQAQAEDDSNRRVHLAESTLDQTRGRENTLKGQRDQLESARASQRANADETQRLTEASSQRLQQQSQRIEGLQQAGEASLSRIDQLDSQAEQSARNRDQAASDQQSGSQQVQSLQSQVEGLQRQASTPPPPGNSGAKPNQNGNGKPAVQAEAVAQAQESLQQTQQSLQQAQQRQEEARQRQAQAEESLRTSQQAANQERQRLESTRTQLDAGLQARAATQEQTQRQRAHLQQDQDRVKDLGGHTRDINAQFDSLTAARAEALRNLEGNRANASAARQNVETLQNLSQQRAFSNPQNGDSQEATREYLVPPEVTTGDSGNTERVGASEATPLSADVRSRSSSPPTVENQGQRTVVRLQSLQRGLNQSSLDTGLSASRHQSGVEAGEDLGSASLAAAAAASSPNSLNASSQNGLGTRSPGRSGEAPGRGNGNGPPPHSQAGGNGRGRRP